MADVNFYLRDNNATKETGVMLFLSYAGKRFKIGTVEKIHPKFWDSENQRAKQVKSFPTYPEFNQRLKDIANISLDVYRKYLNDNKQQQPTPETIKELIRLALDADKTPETKPDSLFSFIEKFIQESQNRINDKTGKPLTSCIINNYRRTFAILREYSKYRRAKIDFDSITLDFYLDFKEYLSKDLHFSTNTIGKHIKTLKTFLNDATERGINNRLEFKSKRFKVTTEDVDNIYLNLTELNTLYKLDLSENKRLERVRDLFLVGCFSGLRFSDFSAIKPEHFITENGAEYIEIETQKTKQTVVIPVHWMVKEIMKRYEGLTINSLPPAISNVKMNKYLKEVGKLAGFSEPQQVSITKQGKEVIKLIPKYDLITTHTARRSFSSNMYLMGVPTITIMSITGHKTEKAFLRYIKITPREHAIKLKEIWQRQLMQVV